METFNKDSKPYLSKMYQNFFDAAQTATLAAEETVAYSQSLERFNSYLSGVELSYSEGRMEEKLANARAFRLLNVDIETISKATGLSIQEILSL